MDLQVTQLVEAARAGDAAAANQLVEQSYQRIFAFLRRLAGGEADAADLTQRTFARVWSALPTFARQSSVSCWMHSIAYRTYVDWLRSRPRHEPRPDAWWEACPDRGRSPAEATAASDLAATLYASVDRLEADVRATVHLHYYQELTLDETAEVLGVAASTVKYRLRQALKILQQDLRDDRPRLAPNLHPSAL